MDQVFVGVPLTDPYKNNWFASPGPLDPYWLAFDKAFKAALPPEWQAIMSMSIGLPRVAAFYAQLAKGPAVLANGKQIADPRIMAYGLSPYSEGRNSLMYLAIEPEIVFPQGYPALWIQSTDIEDFPEWGPAPTPHPEGSPIGQFEGVSPVNGLPRFAPVTGDTRPVGSRYPATGTTDGHSWIKAAEGSGSMIGGQVPVFWFQVQ